MFIKLVRSLDGDFILKIGVKTRNLWGQAEKYWFINFKRLYIGFLEEGPELDAVTLYFGEGGTPWKPWKDVT